MFRQWETGFSLYKIERVIMIYISLNRLFGQMNIRKARLQRTEYLFFKKQNAIGSVSSMAQNRKIGYKLTHIYSESIRFKVLFSEANTQNISM